MTNICPHCGTANRLGSNFCNNCGTELSGDGSPAASSAASEAPHEPEDVAAAPASTDAQGEDQRTGAGEAGETDDHGEPLPPLFDLGLASPGAEDRGEIFSSQPWLNPASDDPSESEAETPSDVTADETDAAAATGMRLVTGVQGLLAPLNISSGDQGATAGPRQQTDITQLLPQEQVQQIRRRMGAAPVMAAQLTASARPSFPSLRVPWVFWLIGLAVALPALGIVSGPVGRPQEWPGVRPAYAAVENLPNGADVLVYFAYDPATSGEMDMVSVPVLRHLLDQRSNLTFVSLNPNGPASARRLVRRALVGEMTPMERSIAVRRITARNYYLSGGAVVLPLLGQAPQMVAPSEPTGLSLDDGSALPSQPSLAVILAPRAEDVQYWLELVQPLNRTPAIAVTGAGVDPMVRPYLDSGQLRGLVSGFDGAETYAALLDQPRSKPEVIAARVQLTAQNWGHLALFAILLVGNLVGLTRKSGGEGP